MLRHDLGEEPIASGSTPYIPGYVPGQALTYRPGSAYGTYRQPGIPTYGNIEKENIIKEDEYTSHTEENMGGNMFAGEGKGMGAEDFGPPAPTGTQLAIQQVRDIATSELKLPSTLNTTTILFAVGGVVAAYFLYQYMYSEA